MVTESNSSTSSENQHQASKILLIDLENCPNQIQQLPKSLIEYTQVVICYAHSTAKIPLDWLMPLNDTINNNKLKIPDYHHDSAPPELYLRHPVQEG